MSNAGQQALRRLGSMQGELDVKRTLIDIQYNFDALDLRTSMLTVFTGMGIYNVLDPQWGVPLDGVNDDAAGINRCITAAIAAGVHIIYFPEGRYLIKTPLIGSSLMFWIGEGMQRTILDDHPSLGGNMIMSVQGTVGSRLTYFGAMGMTVSNGVASTGTYTVGKNGTIIKYADYISFTDVEWTEIAGTDSCSMQYSTNIYANHCRFYRHTYAGFTVLIECDVIRVEDTLFDTATSLTTPNTYLFSTGSGTLGVGDYFCRNIWLTRCRFLNNPRWEGIDFHGGENIWIEDCYVENVKVGLLLSATSGFVANPRMKNATVKNLIAKHGPTATEGSGIIMQGIASRTVLAENINIYGGSLEGFGGVTSSNTGAITVSATKNLHIRDVTIPSYYAGGIIMVDYVLGALIDGVIFQDCLNPSFGNSTAISLRSTGLYGIRVARCELSPTSWATTPKFFLGSAGPSINLQLGTGEAANRVLAVQTARYFNVGNLPVEKAAIPTTSLRLQYGDVVLTNTGKPGWYCSAPAVGYGSLDTVSIWVKADMALGSTTLTNLVTTAGDYRDLPPGMNITVSGAGVAGADLNALIVANNITSLELSVAASTAVTGANVKYQGLTLTAA